MNWPTDKPGMAEVAEPVAPGVARVRPAVFRSITTKPPAETASSRGPSALRAYQQRAEAAPAIGLGGSHPVLPGPAGRLGGSHPVLPGPAGRLGGSHPVLPGPGGQEASRSANRPIVELHPRGTGARGAAPDLLGMVSETRQAPATGGLEQYLAPLRGLSRDLVGRGMPSPLVAELLAEIVTEYGNQVLASEQDARIALAEQLLLRIVAAPLVRPDIPLTGAYVVSGPAGSGKSVLISHLALAAAQQGQTDVVLVNTEGERIGAAAQMQALGTVFGYRVAHAYTPQELHALKAECTAGTLLLVEAAGWSPSDSARQRAAWTWQLPGAANVVCVPATSQAEDMQEFLTAMRQAVRSPVATLCRTGETRNALPVLSVLAGLRQPIGMVVPGPNLLQASAPIDLALVVRTALSVVSRSKKREADV